MAQVAKQAIQEGNPASPNELRTSQFKERRGASYDNMIKKVWNILYIALTLD
jgi:hypothetical protein